MNSLFRTKFINMIETIRIILKSKADINEINNNGSIIKTIEIMHKILYNYVRQNKMKGTERK